MTSAAPSRSDGDVIGFAYGYRSEPGQWWHDAVSAALAPAVAARWLADCFEVVEVAVAPSEQRRGVGTALHGCLLDGLTQSTAALSVMQDHGPAVAFYRRLGWRELLADFKPPGGGVPMLIMGRDVTAGKAIART